MLGINDPRLDALFRKAVACNECFLDGQIKRSPVDIAQPRWIGPGYATASLRVLIISTNPGAGEHRRDRADADYSDLLHAYANKEIAIDEIFAHQYLDFPNWNKLLTFYIDGFGLSLNLIALANIAWCSIRKNDYPDSVLKKCFSRHTSELIQILEPQLIILGGIRAADFYDKIRAITATARIERTLHFAHRKSKLSENEEAARMRGIIAKLTERYGK